MHLPSNPFNPFTGTYNKVVCVFSLMYLLAGAVMAQEPQHVWTKREHTGERKHIVSDLSGNAYVFGEVEAGTRKTPSLTKITATGEYDWFRGTEAEDPLNVAIGLVINNGADTYALSNGYRTGLEGPGHSTLMKHDAAGNLVWREPFNTSGYRDISTAIAIDKVRDEVVIVGYSTTSSALASSSFFAVKYDAAGNRIWSETFARFDSYNIPTAVTVDASGNVYVIGRTVRASGATFVNDWTTLKYSPAGVLIWQQHFNYGLSIGASLTNDVATELALDEDGNAYVLGTCDSKATLIKYRNSDGDRQWTVHNPLSRNEPGWTSPKLAVHDSDNIYVAMADPARPRIDILKFGFSSAREWARSYQQPIGTRVWADDLEVDVDGNIYAAASQHHAGNFDSVVKYDEAGNSNWVLESPISLTRSFQCNDLHVDHTGIYLAGSFEWTGMDLTLEQAVKYTNPRSISLGVIPEGLIRFERFDFDIYGYLRDWCWTDILIDWKLTPLCLMPPFCDDPFFSASLINNGKAIWQSEFNKPFKSQLPKSKEFREFRLATKIDKVFQDVVSLDDELVKNGFEVLSLSAFPEANKLSLNVKTSGDVQVPFLMTLLNKDGKAIWQKDFIAPLETEISEVLNERGVVLQFSSLAQGTKLSYFPNPFSEQLTVKIGDNAKFPADVSVFSLQGKKILQQPVQQAGNFVVKMNGQKPGLYVLIFKSADGEVRELIELK
jgi:hypothetical protein